MNALDALAKAMYDAVTTAKPEWHQLGDLTQNSWRKSAARALASLAAEGHNVVQDDEPLA